MSTVPQHQWISKPFGFSFVVEYRPGHLNTVADALSRRDTEDATVAALSEPTFALLDDIRFATAAADDACRLLQRLQARDLAAPWRLDDGLLLHGSRIFVLVHSDLCHQVLLLAHSAGHEGVQKTLHRLQTNFFILDYRALIQDFVRTCNTC